MIIIPDRTSKTNAIITRAMTFIADDVDTPAGKQVFEALSSLIDNVHSEDEILDAVKAEWKKEFGNLQDRTERDCYFVCGLISEALKNLK